MAASQAFMPTSPAEPGSGILHWVAGSRFPPSRLVIRAIGDGRPVWDKFVERVELIGRGPWLIIGYSGQAGARWCRLLQQDAVEKWTWFRVDKVFWHFFQNTYNSRMYLVQLESRETIPLRSRRKLYSIWKTYSPTHNWMATLNINDPRQNLRAATSKSESQIIQMRSGFWIEPSWRRRHGMQSYEIQAEGISALEIPSQRCYVYKMWPCGLMRLWQRWFLLFWREASKTLGKCNIAASVRRMNVPAGTRHVDHKMHPCHQVDLDILRKPR